MHIYRKKTEFRLQRLSARLHTYETIADLPHDLCSLPLFIYLATNTFTIHTLEVAERHNRPAKCEDVHLAHPHLVEDCCMKVVVSDLIDYEVLDADLYDAALSPSFGILQRSFQVQGVIISSHDVPSKSITSQIVPGLMDVYQEKGLVHGPTENGYCQEISADALHILQYNFDRDLRRVWWRKYSEHIFHCGSCLSSSPVSQLVDSLDT